MSDLEPLAVPGPRPSPIGSPGANVHYATDGRDILINDPDGWEVDQQELWWDGPAGGDGQGGPWGNPPPGAQHAAPGLRGVTLPAVSRCLQLTADRLASMPWKVYRGRDRLDPPLWIVDPQNLEHDGRRAVVGPSAMVRFSGFDFWAQYIRSLLLVGEGIAYTPRVLDADGEPTGAVVAPCYILNPNHLEVIDGRWYVIEEGVPPDEWVELDDRELLVTRWVIKPGHKRGIGVIGAHAADLAFGADVRAYADNLLQRGIPNGYLKSSKPDLTQAQADGVRKAWIEKHGGSRKSIAVLNATTEFHPISLDPKSMQYLEMKRSSAWEVCLMFGVPPSKLGINMGMSNTYANLESDNTAYVQDTLLTIAARIEGAVDAALPVGQSMKVDMNSLMRADTTGRYSAYEVGLRAGFLTVDEVRAFEDLPPLPPGSAAPAPVTPVGASEPVPAV
jgi:HK97 family phage portal protein